MVFDKLLSLLYPPKCIYCQRILLHHIPLHCEACLLSLPRIPREDMVERCADGGDCVSAGYYRGALRAAFLRYKFQGKSFYSEEFIPLLVLALRESALPPFDAVTFVPLTAQKRKKRGYDQAQLLAEGLALHVQRPLLTCLVHTKQSKTQSSLAGYPARRDNVKDSFAPKDREAFAGLHLLLLDDVYTSGATMAECRAVLLRSGAASVSCVTLLRVQKSERHRAFPS